jgi:hypothetical protein
LTGRELAIAAADHKRKAKQVFPLVAKDFGRMMIGLCASVIVVIVVHNLK